jgi:hypothetical protein
MRPSIAERGGLSRSGGWATFARARRRMKAPAVPRPAAARAKGNAMFGFDLPLWAILLIIAALIALIAALLCALYAAVQTAVSGGGGAGKPAGGAAPPPPGYAAPLQQMQTLLQTLQSEHRKPTSAECKQLRDLMNQAASAGAPAAMITQLQTAIGQIC